MDSIPAPETQPRECDACALYQCNVRFPGEFKAESHHLDEINDKESRRCILHYRSAEKDLTRLDKAVKRKMEAGDFNFREAVFPSHVGFEGNIENAKFDDATFYGDADFSEAIFTGKADFVFAMFTGKAYFCEATFRAKADFGSVVFNDTADFSEVKFEGDADFNEAVFSGKAIFDHAGFRAKVDFGDATFSNRGCFIEATFNGEGLFRLFTRALNDGRELPGNDKPGLDFFGVRLNQPEKIRFESFDLSEVHFVDTDVRKVDFAADVKWPEKLCDEHETNPSQYPLVEKLYRQLRQNYEDQRNYPDAGHFYYGEMQMRRKAKWWRRYLPSLTTLYWLSSGYGQRPMRASAWIGVLFLFFTGLYLMGGLQLQPPYTGPVIHPVRAALLHCAEVLTFARERTYAPARPAWGWVSVVQTMVMPLQLALFALAVRRKFQR